MRNRDYLFNDFDLRSVIEGQEKAAYSSIDTMDSNRLLNTSEEDLINYFVEKFKLDSPVIHDEKIYVDQNEAQVDVSQDWQRGIFDRDKPFYITGTKITFYIPFTGDVDLLKCQPPTHFMNPIQASISNSEIVSDFTITDHNPEPVKAQFDQKLSQIKSTLLSVYNASIEFNERLPALVAQHLKLRKEKILKDQGLVASFGFPMKKNDDSTHTYTVPMETKKIEPVLPAASTQPYKPEPILDMENYENILSIVSGMAKVLERSPKTFINMEEEDLRQHFLVQLNGQYKGQATGETFNSTRKTDILVRVEDKNIFIAECKFWKGPSYFTASIDQLLGYTTWRDSKTALIVFNRNKNLSEVLAQIPTLIKQHPNYKKEISVISETSFRYLFCNKDDRNRDLLLTVLVFEVPTS